MDSVNYWYRKIYNEFFKDLKFNTYVNYDFTSAHPYYLMTRLNDEHVITDSNGIKNIIFFDQEPVDLLLLTNAAQTSYSSANIKDGSVTVDVEEDPNQWMWQIGKTFFVTSDKSDQVFKGLKNRKMSPIYYFFHAIAAVDWYRNYWKDDIQINLEHEYLFVSYQHYINQWRLHRVEFLIEATKSGIINDGLVSFKYPGDNEILAFIDRNRYISSEKKKYLLENIHLIAKNRYIDTEDIKGSLSTSIDVKNSTRAFLQVVTETVFYHPGKKHLTEKIFKPIVCKQPFLLLGGKDNLKYLREYGFKTFSDYWDESYDDIEDPSERVDAVIKVLKRLSELPRAELVEMKKDMRELLEYNNNHFFYDLKNIVVDEFIANLKIAFANRKIHIPKEKYSHLSKVLKF